MPLTTPFPPFNQMNISETNVSVPISPSQEEIEEALDILFPNSRPISRNRPSPLLLGKKSLMNIHPAFQKVTWPSNPKTTSFQTPSL
jgi:hypothetical protein